MPFLRSARAHNESVGRATSPVRRRRGSIDDDERWSRLGRRPGDHPRRGRDADRAVPERRAGLHRRGVPAGDRGRGRRGEAEIPPLLPGRRGRRAARPARHRRGDRASSLASDRRQRPARPPRPRPGLRRALGPLRPAFRLASLRRRRPGIGVAPRGRDRVRGRVELRRAGSARSSAASPRWRARRGSLVISSEVGHRKPHPNFYLAASARLGLAPDRVLCAGDDLENDVRGPERAGLRGLLLDRDGRSPAGVTALPDLASLVRRLSDAGVGPGVAS